MILNHAKKFAIILSFSTFLAQADEAEILQNQYKSLLTKLNNNQFNRPLVLNSIESPNIISGDIYAVIDFPFSVVNNSLNSSENAADNWCEVLMLHLNTKYCHTSVIGKNTVVAMGVGKKSGSFLSNVYDLQLNYQSNAASKDYFQINFNAATGPLGTKDYHILLEALPIDQTHTFLHMTYSYGYGAAGRIAMKTYLSTIARNKVGFTKIAPGSNEYVGGVRGMVERNTMRYYLAINAYLSSLTVSSDKRFSNRLTNWFDSTEQYSRQLHEMEREDYLLMKHQEIKTMELEK